MDENRVDQNRTDESTPVRTAQTPAPRHRASTPEASRLPSPHDLEVLSRQLGRPVRDVVEIPARCVCGNPLVAATSPRLSNGTPFPTTFYLTHPVITSAVSRLEAAGLMNEMNDRLAADAGLAARYRAAHEAYLASRAEIGARSGHRCGPGNRRRLGRRNADARQMPARPRGALAGRRAGREPAR